MGEESTIDIVIVGGGVCGLSLAVALQKKGFRDFIVLERSETLRIAGGGIGILTNGWRALEELGVASKLRLTSPLGMHRAVDTDLDGGKQRASPVSYGEARCVKRTALIDALAQELPPEKIRFGCELVSLNSDVSTSTSFLQLSNGSSIRAKVVVGCDGANSVISNFLGLKPTKVFSLRGIRGFAYYPQGHGFYPEFSRIRRGATLSGRMAIDDKFVHWFVAYMESHLQDSSSLDKDHPEWIKQFALRLIKDFPDERVETVKNCDLSSLTLTRLRYRAPWDLVFERFRRGCVTVAGDAMHVMGPFLGQGGSAAMEDAVVLARCLSRRSVKDTGMALALGNGIEEALDEYVKERKMRVVLLSTQTYLMGVLLEASSSSTSSLSLMLKMMIVLIMMVMFKDPVAHTRYNCGKL